MEVAKYGNLDKKALTARCWCFTSLANQAAEE